MVRHVAAPLYVNSVGDKIPLIPGFKTSATFLTSLSANLLIPDDDLYPTPISTPSFRGCSDAFALPTFSPLSAMSLPQDATVAGAQAPRVPTDATSPLEGVNDLTTYTAESQEDRVAALKLVADSIAQQRQVASRAVMYHPATIAGFGAIIALIGQLLYKNAGDLPVVFTTAMGSIMAILITIRWFTGPYLELAEKIGWSWLGDNQMLVTKWGDDVIGTVVLSWAKPESPGGSRREKKKNDKKKWAIIRAWTVKVKYRGKGVGKALLEDAVQEAKRRGAEGIEFADEHANSQRILHSFFNKGMDQSEQRAVDTLYDISSTKGNFRNRR